MKNQMQDHSTIETIEFGSRVVKMDKRGLEVGFPKLVHQAGLDTYDTLSDDDQGLIAFGMAPIQVAESFTKQFGEMLTKNLHEKLKSVGIVSAEGIEEAAPTKWIDRIMTDCNKEFYLGLLDAADKAGKLVV